MKFVPFISWIILIYWEITEKKDEILLYEKRHVWIEVIFGRKRERERERERERVSNLFNYDSQTRNLMIYLGIYPW